MVEYLENIWLACPKQTKPQKQFQELGDCVYAVGIMLPLFCEREKENKINWG